MPPLHIRSDSGAVDDVHWKSGASEFGTMIMVIGFVNAVLSVLGVALIVLLVCGCCDGDNGKKKKRRDIDNEEQDDHVERRTSSRHGRKPHLDPALGSGSAPRPHRHHHDEIKENDKKALDTAKPEKEKENGGANDLRHAPGPTPSREPSEVVVADMKTSAVYNIPVTPKKLLEVMKQPPPPPAPGDGDAGRKKVTKAKDKKAVPPSVPEGKAAAGTSMVMTKIQPGKTRAPKLALRKEEERLDFVGDTSEYASLADIEDVFTPANLQKVKEELEQMRRLEQRKMQKPITSKKTEIKSKIVSPPQPHLRSTNCKMTSRSQVAPVTIRPVHAKVQQPSIPQPKPKRASFESVTQVVEQSSDDS